MSADLVHEVDRGPLLQQVVHHWQTLVLHSPHQHRETSLQHTTIIYANKLKSTRDLERRKKIVLRNIYAPCRTC